MNTLFGVQAKCCFIGLTKHTPLAKSVGGVSYHKTNEVLQVEPRITSELLQVYPCITNKLLQVYLCITNCLSPDVVTILVIQVFWRRRNVVLAVVTIPSISLVAVGVAEVKLVVYITPFLGAMVIFVNFGILEMSTISAYRCIPVSAVARWRFWGASCRPS